ncbi:MAG: riboflavin synthase [Proteobacteria bacterium]|nr:riboflavin synthase [Pseudomonadota bacterium]
MFTGLVQDVGTIARLERRGDEARLKVKTALRDFNTGESIAVDGACLTVDGFGASEFTAFASRETLSLTGLGSLSLGTRVNLERASRLGDPMGGHLLTGHVDARVSLLAKDRAGEAELWTLALPQDEKLARQIARKGSVALDGVSLTVNGVGAGSFEVTLIPHTLASTTLGGRAPGARLNLETDVLAKYVARQLDREGGGGVDMELLVRSGFVR